MSCAHGFAPEDHETAFSVDASAIVFGRGAVAELGSHARSLGMKRVALFTDPRVAALPFFEVAKQALGAAGIDCEVYDRVKVEPTDDSFLAAARFAHAGRFDGYVSVGGGSVIDTCKAAALYATYPAPFLAYVNAPIGEGRAVPGPLPPHIACPTTCGTGSETTAIAVCDVLSLATKTGIVSRRLRPTLALVDPACTASLPGSVVAASGFDVLCHALESFTARAFSSRQRPADPSQRPLSQGRNAWSDLGSREALRLGGKYLVRAVNDASDTEAREQLSWAATLAGIAFGNAGVHLPHAMAYAVAGLVHGFRMPGYPDDEPMVPHGVSVVVSAPSVFRWTASACAERHLEAAELLGADVRSAGPVDAGRILSDHLSSLMRATAVPNGISGVGYGTSDLDALAQRAALQKRLCDNAPRPTGEAELHGLFERALHCW
ncbi:MAG: hydroxyacid-oxoacid transhydrogenase [Polyangiaceae bacterium]